MSPRRKRWKASSTKEKAKLALSLEGDWKLRGSSPVLNRTRGAGQGKPNLNKRFVNEQSPVPAASSSSSSSYDSDWSYHQSEDSDCIPSDDGEVAEDKKPPATRVIVEVEGLVSTLEMNSICMQCDGPVTPTLRTLCLATSIMLSCKDPSCGFIYHSTPPAEVDVDNDTGDHRERTTDYAINILYVLGFLSCGDGCTEAARLLGMLGLPNDTTMQSRSFKNIEERIADKLQQLSDDILEENLIEEVRLSTADPIDFDLWKQSIIAGSNVVLSKARYPGISCSFDMGWQQRSSGVRYNSPSGHALLVGAHTRKPVAFVLKSKRCNYCFQWKKKMKGIEDPFPPLPHKCTRNHESSSSAMEPQACLSMVVSTFDRYHVVVERICADDDSSTRALLKWSNADYMRNNNTTIQPTVPKTKGKEKGKLHIRPDRGQLPPHVPEPLFVADPNHRKKVLTGEFMKILNDKVANKFTFTKVDATRIGKNFAYMVRQLPKMQEEEYETAGKAVLAHHFDNHEFCGPWCRRKVLLARGQEDKKKRFYRSMDKDGLLHSKLQEIVARFITVDRLKEVAHGMDTQVNESFNNTFSWVAPKNKVYCGSSSLHNRLSLAIGINSLGMKLYFGRLYKRLGIIMTPNVTHYLTVKETSRAKKNSKCKLTEVKKKRKEAYFENQKINETEAKIARAKREGTYKTGQNMDDSTDEEQQQAAPQPATARVSMAKRKCPHCGKLGHVTVNSRKCLHFVPKGANRAGGAVKVAPAAATRADADDAADVDLMDSLQLVDDPPSDISLSEFQECLTFDEDAADDNNTGVI
jgi:hypothetical protein